MITNNVNYPEDHRLTLSLGRPMLREWCPLFICAGIYILATVSGAIIVTTVAGLPTRIKLIQWLIQLGAQLPGDITGQNILQTRHYTATIEWYCALIIIFIAYIASIYFLHRLLKSHGSQSTYRRCLGVIVTVSLIVCLIYLISPTTISMDVYSYESYGRLITMHGANPYFVPPAAYAHDKTLQWVYWKEVPSIYGPIWTLIDAALSLFKNPTQFRIMFQYRCIGLLAYFVTLYFIYRGLRTLRRSEQVALLGTLIFAWNPLTLIESVEGAHNDIVMVMFLVIGLYLLARAEQNHTLHQASSYYLPLISFTLATLIKFSAAPAIAIGVLLLLFTRIRADSKDGSLVWWPALRAAILAGLACVILIVLFYIPFWVGHSLHSILKATFAQPSMDQSINSLLSTFVYYRNAQKLPGILTILTNHKLWSLLNLLAMLIPLAIGCRYLWRRPNTRTAVLILISVFAGFLITAAWFFSWYLLWIVAIVPFILPVRENRFARALFAFTITFSATAFIGYYTTWVGWMQVQHNDVSWSILLNIILLGLPLAAFLLAWYYWPFAEQADHAPALSVPGDAE